MTKAKFGLVEGLTLKRYVLVRKLYLQELLQVETKPCGVCNLNREILYSASYDRDRNVEIFDVCDLCGNELIDGSKTILQEIDEQFEDEIDKEMMQEDEP